MSWLDSTLKDLHNKKMKVEFFAFLRDKLIDIKNAEFSSIDSEVKDVLKGFIDSQIDMIESNEIIHKTEIAETFSSEEVAALKLLVSKAMNRPKAANTPFESAAEAPIKPKTPAKTQDKIQFALANRHLDGKEVSVTTPNGNVTGKVVGLDAPHVIIRTDTGHTVPVLLENLIY